MKFFCFKKKVLIYKTTVTKHQNIEKHCKGHKNNTAVFLGETITGWSSCGSDRKLNMRRTNMVQGSVCFNHMIYITR